MSRVEPEKSTVGDLCVSEKCLVRSGFVVVVLLLGNLIAALLEWLGCSEFSPRLDSRVEKREGMWCGKSSLISER
jgi:hypothetical protein